LLAVISSGTTLAQQAPGRIVRSADGTLYLVTADTRYVVNLDPISDGDLAALADGGSVGSQLVLPPAPVVSQPAAAPAADTTVGAVHLSGRGQTATEAVTPPSGNNVVTLTHDGKRNFIVEAFQGSSHKLLVNTIGAYQGGRPWVGSDPVTFNIEADGSWTLDVTPVATGGTAAFAGHGDAVSASFDPTSTGPWAFANDGARNFIVEVWCQGGHKLAENRIGAFQGTAVMQFPQGPCFWEVQSDGNWSMAPR
jgi:hypothetical protein